MEAKASTSKSLLVKLVVNLPREVDV